MTAQAMPRWTVGSAGTGASATWLLLVGELALFAFVLTLMVGMWCRARVGRWLTRTRGRRARAAGRRRHRRPTVARTEDRTGDSVMAPTTNQPEPTRRPRTALLAVAAVCAAGFTAQTVLVLAHRGAPFPLDIAVHHWAVVHRTGGLTTAAVAISATGTGLPVYILAILAGCLAGGSRRWWGGAVAAVAALALGEALRYGISVAVARPRPFRGDWAHSAGGFAFPSGHTTTSALVAALLLVALARRRPGPWVVLGRLIAVSWAICVGLTRVYLGVHWPTDVLGGWLLAATLATVAAGVGPVLVSGVGRSRTRPLGDTRH